MKFFLVSLIMSLTLGITSNQSGLEIGQATKVTVTIDDEVLTVVFAPPGSELTFFGEYEEEKLHSFDGTEATRLTGIDGMKLLKNNSELVSVSAPNATALIETVDGP